MSKHPVISRHLCAFCEGFLGNSNVVIWLTTASSPEGQSNPVYSKVHDWIRDHTVKSREDLDYDGIAAEGRTLITLRTRASLAIASDQGCSYCMHDLRFLDHSFQDDDSSIIFTYEARDHEPYIVSREDVCPTSRVHTRLATSIIDTIHVGQLRAFENGTWEKVEKPGILKLTALPDSAAAAGVTTEPIVRKYNKNTQYAYDKIHARMQRCTQGHKSCPQPGRAPLPDRVIYIENVLESEKEANFELKLVERSQAIERYVVLSYCWGMASQPVMTSKTNLAAFKDRLPYNELPQAIKDAIMVAWKLGVRHLWVDSLCIVQDSSHDKEIQIGKIRHYFTQAYLTICAASSATCDEGFLNSDVTSTPTWSGRLKSPDFSVTYLCSDGTTGPVVLQPDWAIRYDSHDQPINSRAWTLEERLLSPRMLLYDQDIIIWQCCTGLFTIGGSPHSIYGTRGGPGRSSNMLLSNTFFDEPSDLNTLPPDQVNIFKTDWTRLVENYTDRKLGRPTDRLRAISGIASLFQHVFVEHEYLAGLWYNTIAENAGFFFSQILWFQRVLVKIGREGYGDPKAPSWSWASVSTQVEFPEVGNVMYEIRRLPVLTKIRDYEVSPLTKTNSFGAVNPGASLTMTCQYRKARTKMITRDSFEIPTLSLVMVEGHFPNLRIELDDRLVDFCGNKEEAESDVWFLRVVGTRGLVLFKDADGRFSRIGAFCFASSGDIAGFEVDEKGSKAFFEHCQVTKFTII